MIWLWTSILSALLLGFYDVAKKQSLRKNGVFDVLLYATAISTLFFLPLLLSSLCGWGLGSGTLFDVPKGELRDYLLVASKAVLVAASWIFGILGMKHLPLTTVGIIKASRPVFVLLGCIFIFGERLNPVQWGGVLIAMAALFLLGRSSRNEGINFAHNIWIYCMAGSVLFGVLSALYDKYIMSQLNQVFVQGWGNFFLTVFFAIAVLLNAASERKKNGVVHRFQWDWSILLIAFFVTVSDFLYFYSLTCDGSMLSVVSMLRRSSVVITFACGAMLFKEQNIRAKALEMVLLLVGMALLLFGSY